MCQNIIFKRIRTRIQRKQPGKHNEHVLEGTQGNRGGHQILLDKASIWSACTEDNKDSWNVRGEQRVKIGNIL